MQFSDVTPCSLVDLHLLSVWSSIVWAVMAPATCQANRTASLPTRP